MEPITFSCPHCKKKMGVGSELLGKKVRCPHCKQVLQTPSSVPVLTTLPDELPTFQPPAEPVESIFSDESPDEDLFGTRRLKPELPVSQVLQDQVTKPLPPPVEDFNSSPTIIQSLPPIEKKQSQPVPLPDPIWKQPVVLVILGYASLMTLLVLYLLFTRPDPKDVHPFMAIPDVFGEYEKADGKKTSYHWLPKTDLAIPAELRVPLGGTLAIGDLQVQPWKVEKKVLELYQLTSDGEAEKIRNLAAPSYVIHLKLKNLSKDLSFYPTDPAFNRRSVKEDTVKPYTALCYGKTWFYGGPFWWPAERGKMDQFLGGQEQDRFPLKPQEERETIVCTTPGEPIDAAIRQRPDDRFLWRIQLRRGTVPFRDDQNQKREMSVTTVIGVEFSPQDVVHQTLS